MIEIALKIATDAHQGVMRKWGANEPYITHPIRCVAKAKSLGYPEFVQCALALHDVGEDVAIPTNTVPYWEQRIKSELSPIGESVLALVWELTNISDTREWIDAHPNPKRIEKWAVNLAHIKEISDLAKACKMIDRIDNLSGNIPHKMLQKYLPESRDLLEVCRHTDDRLAKELEEAIRKLS